MAQALKSVWTDGTNLSTISNLGANTNLILSTSDMRSSLDPIGFPETEMPLWTPSYTEGSRTFSNALSTASASYYFQGQKVTLSGSQSKQISTAAGVHYLSYTNTDGNIYDTSSTWGFSNAAQIAIVYVNSAGEAMLFAELHGIGMDWETHRQMHISEGSRYASGFVGSFSATNFSMSAGAFLDEDILHTSPATNSLRVIYHTNSTLISWTTNTFVPYLTSGGNNLLYDNGSTTSVVPAGSYVSYWVAAANSVNVPLISIMGQRTDSTLANALANNTYNSLNQSAMPSPEIKPLYRVTYHRAPGTGNIVYDQTDDYRAGSLTTLTVPATGIGEAPMDGTTNARSMGAWVAITPGGGSSTTITNGISGTAFATALTNNTPFGMTLTTVPRIFLTASNGAYQVTPLIVSASLTNFEWVLMSAATPGLKTNGWPVNWLAVSDAPLSVSNVVTLPFSASVTSAVNAAESDRVFGAWLPKSFCVYLTNSQTIAGTAYADQLVVCNYVYLDNASAFSTVSGLYIPTSTGAWDVSFSASISGNAAADGAYVGIRHVSGVTTNIFYTESSAFGGTSRALINVLTTNDTIGPVIQANDTSYVAIGQVNRGRGDHYSIFSGHQIR